MPATPTTAAAVYMAQDGTRRFPVDDDDDTGDNEADDFRIEGGSEVGSLAAPGCVSSVIGCMLASMVSDG